MSLKRIVIVTFRQEGFHRWVEAPPDRKYLREIHRHIFHFRVEAQVERGDRQVEFHDLLDSAWQQASEYRNTLYSCEELAEILLLRLQKVGWHEVTAVECWEDGENGARVEALP